MGPEQSAGRFASWRLALAVVGSYSFHHSTSRLTPTRSGGAGAGGPWPGASAEEMERLVSVPLEVTLAGMPGLKTTHSQSFSVCRTCAASSNTAYLQRCAPGSHQSPGDDQSSRCRRASCRSFRRPTPSAKSSATPSKPPRTSLGQEIYTLNDFKALQDWLVEHEFRRVPRIMDITSLAARSSATRFIPTRSCEEFSALPSISQQRPGQQQRQRGRGLPGLRPHR